MPRDWAHTTPGRAARDPWVPSGWRCSEAAARGDGGESPMGTVIHYGSEQPLLSSACKSGQRVTMATRPHVPCETSLGWGVELGLLQTLVGFMSLGQQLLRRHLESLDTESPRRDSERKQTCENTRLVCERCCIRWNEIRLGFFPGPTN